MVDCADAVNTGHAGAALAAARLEEPLHPGATPAESVHGVVATQPPMTELQKHYLPVLVKGESLFGLSPLHEHPLHPHATPAAEGMLRRRLQRRSGAIPAVAPLAPWLQRRLQGGLPRMFRRRLRRLTG